MPDPREHEALEAASHEPDRRDDDRQVELREHVARSGVPGLSMKANGGGQQGQVELGLEAVAGGHGLHRPERVVARIHLGSGRGAGVLDHERPMPADPSPAAHREVFGGRA